MSRRGERRLVIVLNRLLVIMERGDEGWSGRQSSGGLVTALAPVLRNRGGTWIGWPGTSCEEGIKGYSMKNLHYFLSISSSTKSFFLLIFLQLIGNIIEGSEYTYILTQSE
jgi:trehalose-6-phosphate synthase